MGPAGKLQTKAVYLCVYYAAGGRRKTKMKVQIDRDLNLHSANIDGRAHKLVPMKLSNRNE